MRAALGPAARHGACLGVASSRTPGPVAACSAGPSGRSAASRGLPGQGLGPTDPALPKALARAHWWKRMLEEGRYASIGEMAAAERIDRGYLGRVLQLTLLAPDIVEAILDGRHSDRWGCRR